MFSLHHLKKLSSLVYTLITVALLLVAGLLILSGSLIKLPNQIRLFAVQSGSMEPAIKTGSVVLTQPASEYQTNEVITFENRENRDVITTHRLIEKKTENNITTYQTKGDANNVPDQVAFTGDLIIGRVILTVPYLGYILSFAKSQLGFLLVIVLPSAIIIGSEISTLKAEIVRRLTPKVLNTDTEKVTHLEKIEHVDKTPHKKTIKRKQLDLDL